MTKKELEVKVAQLQEQLDFAKNEILDLRKRSEISARAAKRRNKVLSDTLVEMVVLSLHFDMCKPGKTMSQKFLTNTKLRINGVIEQIQNM